MDDLEIVKENVQPLRGGRRIDTLQSALHMDENEIKKREEIKLQFEKEIQEFKDEKLFESYCNYINWIEQNYPDNGKEANLISILENFIKTYYNVEKYKNEERTLSIFLKYVNSVRDPLNVFECFYKLSFARKLALFYINWSFHFEMQNNFKKAINVIKLGIKNQADPAADLTRTLNDLQVKTMRYVANKEEPDPSTQRKALNNLKAKTTTSGKTVAPVNRYGSLVKPNHGLKNQSSSSNTPNETLKVFDENGETAKTFADPVVASKKIELIEQENERKPGKWTENKLSLKKKVTRADSDFEIYEESENPPPSSCAPTDEKPKAVKDDYPIVRFESQDQLKKYVWFGMMAEIYKDNTEYSFEELRYQKWLEKQLQQLNIKTKESFSPAESTTIQDGCTSQYIRNKFFNGSLSTTVFHDYTQQQFDEKTRDISDNENENANFEILADASVYKPKIPAKIPEQSAPEPKKPPVVSLPPPEFEVTNMTFKVEKDLLTCSSSTPVLNKSLKRCSNLMVGRYNNPNFVTGITSNLCTIVETSREEYSKSSSSSSGTINSTACQTQRKLFINTDNVNPFEKNFHTLLLGSLSDPVEFRKGFLKLKQPLPMPKLHKHYKCDDTAVKLGQQISPSIYEIFVEPLNNKSEQKIGSLKLCNQLNFWEFYIYDELERCLCKKTNGTDIELSIMTLDKMIFYNDGYAAFYDAELSWSLRNAINTFYRIENKFPPTLLALITLELLSIIHKLHDWNIIKTNIVPENIIINIANDTPEIIIGRTSLVKMVDFSNAIDMRLLPDGATFNKNFRKEKIYNILNEKNWSYEIDWIGFLNCVHWMLFNSEIEILSENSNLTIRNSFEGIENGAVYQELFEVFLNFDVSKKLQIERLIASLTEIYHENKYMFIIELSTWQSEEIQSIIEV